MLRAAVISATIIVLFGILVPLRKGADFLDPVILSGCLLLSLVIVAPSAAGGFSGDAETGPAALRRLAVIALYSWFMGVAVLAAGLITVNVRGAWRGVAMPRAGFLTAALAASAAATFFVGTVSALVARRYSAAAARNTLRLLFLGFVLFLLAMSRFGGPDWLTAMRLWSTTAHLRSAFTIAAIALAIAGVPLAILLMRPNAPRYSVAEEDTRPI